MSMPLRPITDLSGESGLSLIELMVALTVGLFLIGGVGYVYTASKQLYRVQENLARMQESGRLAVEYLGRDLRMAGYFGCAGAGMTYQTATNQNACLTAATNAPSLLCTLSGTGCADLDFNPSKTIFGHEATISSNNNPTWAPNIPSSLNNVVANTDVLVVKGTSATRSSIIKDPSPNNASLKVNEISDISAGDVLMATDCKSSVIFQACGINPGNVITHDKGNNGGCKSYGNLCQDWGKEYTGGSILKLTKNTYFISIVDGLPTLCRKGMNNVVEPLVPNVENFQITYGVSPTVDDYPNGYYTAQEVDNTLDWDKVKSVRIEMLLRSPDDNITTSNQSVYFAGSDLTPSDRRLRMVAVMTVGLRNRTPLSTK